VTLDEVSRPRPVLDRDRERRLTERQRQLLDALSVMFDDGFAELTMAAIAARLNCSLRTLYALAPSRDELVMVVVDRTLWRIGRGAQEAIAPDMAPLDALRAYLRAASFAVGRTTQAFARDLAAVPAAQRLSDAHEDYLQAMTQRLLDAAVERGDFASGDADVEADAVDTAAVARVLARLGRDFARPDVLPTLRSTPKQAADAVVDLVLDGLRSRSGTDRPVAAGNADR